MDPETFLDLLQQPGTAIRPALTTFSTLGKRPSTHDQFATLITRYLEHDPSCDIIFKLWEHDRTHNQSNDAAIILDSLSSILRFIKAQNSEQAGLTIVLRILNKHQRTLNHDISMQRAMVNKGVLRLLTAMLRLGENAAKAMYRSLDISQQALAALAKKRSPTDRWSVRALFISYITSYFYVQSHEVVSWILQQRPLTQGLFKELEKDPKHTILTLLAGLRHVAGREDIPRNDKLALFTPHHLMILANLYTFQDQVAQRIHSEAKKAQKRAKRQQQEESGEAGTAGDQQDKQQGEQQQQQQQRPSRKEDDERRVPDIVHALLLLLCTHQNAGLCFVPPTTHAGAVDWRRPWHSDTCANSSIQQFLTKLKSPAIHALPGQLFVAACCAAPDVTPLVLSPATVPVDAQLSLTNLANLRLTFSALRHPCPPMRHQMYACVEYRAAMAVPPNITRTPLTKALRSSSAVVVHTAATTLLACLGRLADDMEVTAQRDVAEAERAEFQHALRVAARRRLPDAQVLLTLYTCGYASTPGTQDTKGKGKGKNKGKRKTAGEGRDDNAGDADAAAAVPPAPTRLADTTLGLILRALGYYQRYFPDALSTFDLGRLLPTPAAAARMSPLTLKHLFGVLREAAAVINWLKPGAKDHASGDAAAGAGAAGGVREEGASGMQPAKRAKKGELAKHQTLPASGGQTRLQHVLRIHARAPDSYAPYSAGLLQSIFAHTGAFPGPLMAELAAWWGSVPAHPTAVALLVRTYEHVLEHPMQTAQDLLQVAADAGVGETGSACDQESKDGKDGKAQETTRSAGAGFTMDEDQDQQEGEEPKREKTVAAAVDVSAVLFTLIKEATSWCQEHGEQDTSACVVVATYLADLVVRTMATRTSALLLHIVEKHFLAPLAGSVPAVAPVLAMLDAALRNVGDGAASAALTPNPAFTRDDTPLAAPAADHAAALVAALAQRDEASVVEHVVERVLAWGSEEGTSDLGDIMAAVLTAHGGAKQRGASESSGEAPEEAVVLAAKARGALRVACSFVASARCLVDAEQAREQTTEEHGASGEQAIVTRRVLDLCASHTKAFLACLPLGPSDDDTMKAAVRVQPVPRITCTLDLMWSLRGLTTAVASVAHSSTASGEGHAAGGAVSASRLLWLRAKIEDVNHRVQQFAAGSLGGAGAGVGATRGLSLLLPLCEAGTTTPALARHGLGCVFGNLVRMVQEAQHKALHCSAVLRGILLPRVVGRSWAPASREDRGGKTHMHMTAVDLGNGDVVRVAAGDVHRVLLLHVAARSQHVQELLGNWLGWLAETKGTPSQHDVMFLRAVLTSAKQHGLTVLTDTSRQLLLRLCADATADTASTTDALLELLDIAAPAQLDVAVKKLSATLLRAYVTSITTQRSRVVGTALAANPTHATEVLAVASSSPAVLDNPLSRRIVAECVLQEMHLPAIKMQSAHMRSLLASRVLDQSAPGLWLWTFVARQLLQATPNAQAGAAAGLVSRLRLSVLQALKTDPSNLTWAEALVSFAPGAGDSGGEQTAGALQEPAHDASLSQEVLTLIVRHVAGHRAGPSSSPASLRAWVVTLTALLRSAIAAFESIDRSLELVSQCFPCPLPAVLACQAACLLLDDRHAAVLDEDLRVLQGRGEAGELLETINTFLQTVCSGVLVDLEPAVVQVCRHAYVMGHRVEVASGFNIILDAPRTAELFLHGVSIRRVLTFSENAPYQPPTPLSITKRRLTKAKEEALQFVRYVIEQQPQLMAGDLGHLVLDAYGGSLAPADIISLNLLLFAERKGMRLSRMLLITGRGTSSIRKAYLAKLMTEAVDPMAVEGLARLDAQRLAYTAEHMHHLSDTRSQEHSSGAEDEERQTGTGTKDWSEEADPSDEKSRRLGSDVPLDRALAYDPLYVLPLLRSIATHGGQGCLFDFVEKQCARFCFVALSSPTRRVRLLASATLAAFANAVSKTKLRELQELKTTVQLFQNSVAEPGQQLPCIIVTFAAECCQLSLHPTDLPMYPITMKFVASRPTLDLGDLPLFLNLFNSASMTHRKERAWVLRLLSSGCKTPLDLQLLKRRQAVDVAMSFYLSPLSDHTARVAILDFLAAVAAIEKGTHFLYRCGVMAWLELAVHLIHSNEYIAYYERLLRLLFPLARVVRQDSVEPTVSHLLSNLLLSAERDSRLNTNGPTSSHAMVVDMLRDLPLVLRLGARSKELLAALVQKFDGQ